jgi:hypothetical protein
MGASRAATLGMFIVPGWYSAGDHIETRMQDGIVTLRCSFGRMGSVDLLPPGAIPSWVLVYTLCIV